MELEVGKKHEPLSKGSIILKKKQTIESKILSLP